MEMRGHHCLKPPESIRSVRAGEVLAEEGAEAAEGVVAAARGLLMLCKLNFKARHTR